MSDDPDEPGDPGDPDDVDRAGLAVGGGAGDDAPGDGPGSATSPSDPAARRRRLPERGRDRYLGGVASGLARALDVDPLVVRLALVIGALYAPVVVALYALAWLVLPDARTHQSLVGAVLHRSGGEHPGEQEGAGSAADRWRALLGVAALGIGGAVLATELGPGGDGGLTFGVLLLGIGGLIVLRRPPGAVDDDAGGPDDLDGGLGEPGATPTASPDGGAGRGPLVPWPLGRHRSEPRPPPTLGWLGLSALVLLIGVLVAADRSWEPVKPGVIVSAALVLVGGVVLVAAWRGRAGVVLVAGVALVPLWIGFAATDVPRYEGDGDRTYRVAADDPFPTRLTHGYGNLEVDLRDADLAEGDRRRLRIGMTSGRVEVDVPREVHLDIVGDVGVGNVNVHDLWTVRDDGPVFPGGVAMHLGDPDEPCQQYVDERTGSSCEPAEPLDDPPELELVLDVGIGIVEVNRV